MEQLQHFSHEHPLILNVEDHAQEDVNCCGCNKSILIGESAYSCSTSSHTIDNTTQGDCDNFFLHKTCAELPQELEYPRHQDHPLTLHSRRTCICDVCRMDWKWFTYRCVSCEFDVCLTCALQDRRFHHESHNHPLTLMPREVLLSCDACDTEDKDFSYFCTTCLFWLHKSCASATTTLKCQFHEDHPLVLDYSLPEQYRSFRQDCSICNRILFPNYWIYYCADCRFFAHIKCATSTKTAEPLTLSENENIYEADDDNLMHFPMPDEASLGSLICQFVKEISLTNDTSTATDNTSTTTDDTSTTPHDTFTTTDNTSTRTDDDTSTKTDDNTSTTTDDQINHWAHKDHPLILFHEFKRNNNEMKNEVMLCDGCVQPITADPFYGCLQCKYFLHKYCVQLPKELEHLSHLEHKLVACQFPSPHQFFKCEFCQKYCNGIVYYCKLCNFYIDIVCASLPNKIKHDVHTHPLKQLKLSKCSASEYKYSGFGFGCETCNFYLRKSRAIMPRTVRHRWDPHPLHLMYPPVKDHPHEFDCEVCSIYINPNYWFYHCRDCDMSFHIGCLLRDDIFSNIKFGATVKIDNLHPHHLTFVQNKMKKASCGRCGTGDIRIGTAILECASCKFVICSPCRLEV